MSGRILIVDDEPDSVTYLESVLEEAGYDHVSAVDGIKGLELARQERPMLILLDLIMPEKSGIWMFQELKKDPDLAKIPIIVVSGVSTVTGVDFKHFVIKENDKEDNGHVGTTGETMFTSPDEFVEKPFKPDELIEKIKKLLSA